MVFLLNQPKQTKRDTFCQIEPGLNILKQHPEMSDTEWMLQAISPYPPGLGAWGN